MEIAHVNWSPKTYQEFREMVFVGRIQINIGPSWDAVTRVVPYNLINLFCYNKKVLRAMMDSEEIFWKLHRDIGVDLILLK